MRVIVTHPTGTQNTRGVLAALYRHGCLESYRSTLALGNDAAWPDWLPSGLRREVLRRRYDLPGKLVRARPWREVVRHLAGRIGWRRLIAHERGWACVDQVYAYLDRAVARELTKNGGRRSGGPDGAKAVREFGLGHREHRAPTQSSLSSNSEREARERIAGTVADVVYAYEDGALATFTRARELGILRVYDLPIAYWETLRRLLGEERERLPEWAETLGGGLSDSQAKLERKTRELELADVVIVPSQFVADSLPEWARATKRVVISPFGSPEAAVAAVPVAAAPHGGEQGSPGRQQSCHGGTVGGKAAAVDGAAKQQLRGVAATERAQPATVSQRDNRTARRPLRVLFVGSMGQRKGLGDLMAAVRLLNRSDVELVCMGLLEAPMEFYQQQCPGFTYEKGRPHAEVLELMRSCDVFCLPSIVEGRALVMQEAMSQGLPIIITPNTGGADLVSDAYQIGGCGAAATVAPTAHGAEQGSHGETVDCAAEQQLRGEAATERAQPAPATGSHGDHRAAKQSPHREAMTAQRSATGFLVPIRSPEAIAEAIAWCADHREEVAAMGRAAQTKAAEYTWEAYGDRIVEAIRDEVASRNDGEPERR